MEDCLVTCPYCWEELTIAVSPEQMGQTWIEDCQICCRPMEMTASEAEDGMVVEAIAT